jgi:hypothetical protein
VLQDRDDHLADARLVVVSPATVEVHDRRCVAQRGVMVA